MTGPLLAAAGSVDITPTGSVELAGFAGRHRRSVAIHSPLEANVVVLRRGDTTHVLVSVDLLYVGVVGELVVAKLGDLLTADQVTVAASHTHFAPATEPSLVALGVVEVEYLEAAARAIADEVRAAWDRLAPAELQHGASTTDGVAGRRRRAWVIDRTAGSPLLSRRLWRRPVRAPAIAREVHVLRLVTEMGDVWIWSCTCHPTELPSTTSVSAEYPGVVRERLRALHPGGDARVPVLFLQGFAGDVRPAIFSWWRGQSRAARIENVFNGGRGFAAADEAAWTQWADGLATDVARAGSALTVVPGDVLEVRHRSLPLASVYAGAPDEVEVRLTRLRVGGIVIVALPGEPTSDWAPMVARGADGQVVLPVAYTGRSYGYLPTARVLSEGGYEGGEFLAKFGVDWTMRDDAPQVLEREIRAVLGGSDG